MKIVKTTGKNEENTEGVFQSINDIMVGEVNKLKGTKYTDVVQIVDKDDIQFLRSFMLNYFYNKIKVEFYNTKSSADVFMKTIEYMEKIG